MFFDIWDLYWPFVLASSSIVLGALLFVAATRMTRNKPSARNGRTWAGAIMLATILIAIGFASIPIFQEPAAPGAPSELVEQPPAATPVPLAPETAPSAIADADEAKNTAADEAEAKRKADEDKRIADEAAAKRKAGDDKRVADEAAARRKADQAKREAEATDATERKAVAEAEAYAKRQADEDAEATRRSEAAARAKEAVRAAVPPSERDDIASKYRGAQGMDQEFIKNLEKLNEEAEIKAALKDKLKPTSEQPGEAYDVVSVFFGTNRAERPAAERLDYDDGRTRRLDLGRALVTVPKFHHVPQIERPWSIYIPYFDKTINLEAEDKARHFTIADVKKLTQAEFLELVKVRLGGSQRFAGHALVFVHGYNTSFENALFRTAQISYDLKFDGATFLYSWPSGGGVGSYTYDRESAEGAKPYLKKFLELVVKDTGATSVSIIAHSMGNIALLGVLKELNSSPIRIDQLVLAAPDVDYDSFADLADGFDGIARGVTLYAANNDRALIASRNFWQRPRAGDVPGTGPAVASGVDTIDVSALSTDVFSLNHSGYAQSQVLIDDIAKLVLNGERPPERRQQAFKPASEFDKAFWRYAKP